MTYKAYIDNIYAMTRKTPEDYRKIASEKGLVKYGELLKWLKVECGLGHGHANAIILYIQNPEMAKRKMAEEAKAKGASKVTAAPTQRGDAVPGFRAMIGGRTSITRAYERLVEDHSTSMSDRIRAVVFWPSSAAKAGPIMVNPTSKRG